MSQLLTLGNDESLIMQRCGCWAALARVEGAAGDGAAAMKACDKGTAALKKGKCVLHCNGPKHRRVMFATVQHELKTSSI